ncbi:MAG: hypothetical protein ACYCQK_01000 [Acidiferrobacteraceae bacterium]
MVLGAALLAAAVVPSQGAATIVKCRDAMGHWHYGDRAARACGNRPVYRIDGGERATATGRRRETAVPPAPGAGAPMAHPGNGHPGAGHTADLDTLYILEHTLAHLESEAALAPHPPAGLAREIRETEDQIEAQKRNLRRMAAEDTPVMVVGSPAVPKPGARPPSSVTGSPGGSVKDQK